MNSFLKFIGIRPETSPKKDAVSQAFEEAKDARKELSRSLDISVKLANSVTELIQACELTPARPSPRRHARNKLAH